MLARVDEQKEKEWIRIRSVKIDIRLFKKKIDLKAFSVNNRWT